MPTVQVPAQLDVEHLIAAVKQLSPAELREFSRQFTAWRDKNGTQAGKEAKLLSQIEKNSQLPVAEQRRFNRLRRKRQGETLTKQEEQELQDLWQHVEQMNVVRLTALTKLAQYRGTDVKKLIRELGLSENKSVF